MKCSGNLLSRVLSLHSLWLPIIITWLLLGSNTGMGVRAMSRQRLNDLKDETVDLFYHGYDNYMRFAFPEDELRPITCGPLTRDRKDESHIALNDVLGNYSLTLIDSLSTLAILASSPPEWRDPLKDFQDGIMAFVEQYGDGTPGPEGQGKRARGFDLDSKVQVFETTIRGLGGLLSAHLFAIGRLPIRNYTPKINEIHGKEGIHWPNGFVYNGQLLRLAKDLADRILPAFQSPTGIPYPRVNLKYGVPFYPNSPYNANGETGQCGTTKPPKEEITETCSAGAGSLVLEFATLSQLLDDELYEKAGVGAFESIWARRSSIDLIGSGIDSETGNWVTAYTGIGAGIDSFFEYAFKSYIFFSNSNEKLSNKFLKTWNTAHAAVKRHLLRKDSSQHGHYIQADMFTGAHKYLWVDSLSAFYPGLLALAGEVQEAESAHLLYSALWTRYSAMPERYSTFNGAIEHGIAWWGGRPEFIESAWYLYQATNDPWYLHVGEMSLKDMKRRCYTTCGWAGLQDVRTGEKTDRMESFFLGETAKYLFLLFNPDHPLNSLDAPWVMTTEGHPLLLAKSKKTDKPDSEGHNATIVSATCPVAPSPLPFTVSRTASRPDLFHAAQLARLHRNDVESPSIHIFYPSTLPGAYIPKNGMCKALSAVHFDLSFPTFTDQNNAGGLLPPFSRASAGILLNTLSGVRLGLERERVSNRDPTGHYRIYSLSGLTLGRDEVVYIERKTVRNLNEIDPYFTRRRDTQSAELLVDVMAHPPETSLNLDDEDMLDPELAPNDEDTEETGAGTALITSLFRRMQSLLNSSTAPLPPPRPRSAIKRHVLHAALPTGPGSQIPRDIDSEPGPVLQDSTTSTLHLNKLYFVHENLCDMDQTSLEDTIPKEYDVLVVRRGGCSFSEKLRQIPAYAPSFNSLKLVIVVSIPQVNESEGIQDGDNEYIQPFLDEVQASPGGVVRPHPIPMILVHGGLNTWSMLLASKGIAVRRKWWFESQGVKINNLVVV